MIILVNGQCGDKIKTVDYILPAQNLIHLYKEKGIFHNAKWLCDIV